MAHCRRPARRTVTPTAGALGKEGSTEAGGAGGNVPSDEPLPIVAATAAATTVAPAAPTSCHLCGTERRRIIGLRAGVLLAGLVGLLPVGGTVAWLLAIGLLVVLIGRLLVVKSRAPRARP